MLRTVKVAEGTRPDPPGWLTNAQKVYWFNTLAELTELDLANTADLEALAGFAVACELRQRLATIVAGLSELVAYNSVGNLHAHPLLAELHRVQDQVLRHARELGLTPHVRGELVRRWPDTEAGQNSLGDFYVA